MDRYNDDTSNHALMSEESGVNMKKTNTMELVGKLLERYESQHGRVDHYYGLLAYWALAQAAVSGGREDYLQKCNRYLSLYPDNFEHPHYTFDSYRVGGNARAWLFMKGLMPEVEEELRKHAELTYHAPKGPNDILCLRGHIDREKDLRGVWIDVVTCTTPFMLYAGLALKEEKYIDFAAEQCIKMYELFLDATCGLLHQTKGLMQNPLRMSADHWSRGNGWGLIGLAELMRYLPENSTHRIKAKRYYMDMIDSLLPYQTSKGMWRQEIVEPLAWEESSGTGLILYCMGVGLRSGYLKEDKYREAFEKGIHGLATYCLTDDYATHRGCPGCCCPGTGEEKGSVKAYITEKLPTSDEVHSYGCLMLAFLEAYRNGITEVEIQGLVR